jgi:hypothetical protein
MNTITASAPLSDRLLHFIQLSQSEPGQSEECFNELALELFERQFSWIPVYRRYCESRGAKPSSVRHWSAIPAVPTSAFKEFQFSTVAEPERTHVFLSSGTTGQARSHHFHNWASLGIYEASLLPWFKRHLLADGQSAQMRLMALTPPAATAPNSSLVYMLDTIARQLAFVDVQFFAGIDAERAWRLDLSYLVEVLRDAAAAGRTATLLGTAFSFVHLLDHLQETQQHVGLPAGSRVMETGGYKRQSRVVDKTVLHTLISERLGIPPTHIVSEYGMSELSSQAYDHTAGSPAVKSRVFHFPPWARVQIVSPESGQEVAEGQIGLLRVVDLANINSVCAVQTEDLARRRGVGFEWVGRAAEAEPRGCSLMAGDAPLTAAGFPSDGVSGSNESPAPGRHSATR